MLENFGDAPFYACDVPPITLTAMTRVLCALPTEDAVVGVNVLRNDAAGALAVAAATGADFIRVNVHCGAMVTDQGLIEGRAADTLRRRAALAPGVAIAADVHVKHAAPLAPRPLREVAVETAERGAADAVILSGAATGAPTSLDHLRAVREALPGHPVWVGSGATVESVAALLSVADAVIVGTATKRDGRVTAPVDPARAAALVAAARQA